MPSRRLRIWRQRVATPRSLRPTVAMGQIFQSQLPKRSSGRGRKSVQDGRGLACHHCGAFGHGQQDCSFRTAECHSCCKVGHLAKVCCGRGCGRGAYRGAKGARRSVQGGTVEETTSDNESVGDICQVHTLGAGKVKPGATIRWEASYNGDRHWGSCLSDIRENTEVPFSQCCLK